MTITAKQEAARNPAEIYEELFVPALFRQWGPVVTEAAAIAAGQRVLDVACGTGALTCAVAERVGAKGSVVGLDISQEMLSVARGKSATIEWCEGRAEALPFADESFDAVVSQFGLMFFDDKPLALREMKRVLRRDGHLAVAVCGALDHSPGYERLAELLETLFGQAVAAAFRAPFALGDAHVLLGLCAQGGVTGARVTERAGRVRFASIDALVATESACVWTLGGLLDDAQFARLLSHARRALSPFVAADGAVSFDMPALLITAVRPG